MFEKLLEPFEELLGPLLPGSIWLLAGVALGVGIAGPLRPVAKAGLKAGMGVGDRARGIGDRARKIGAGGAETAQRIGAEAAERAQDMVAEARSARKPARPSARATARPRRRRPTMASASKA